jgi:hypothetical protein
MKPSDDHAARPACSLPVRDLMAQVLDEYDRRRSTLRIAELQLAQLDELVIDGTIDYPTELVQQVLACRRDVAAFSDLLADLLGIGDGNVLGGGPQMTRAPQSDAFRVISIRRHMQKAGDTRTSVAGSTG